MLKDSTFVLLSQGNNNTSTEQEHNAASQQNLAGRKSSIRLLFKMKHSVLTPAHKSQKRDKHKFF